MQLSEHFKLREFTRSQIATRLGIDQSKPPVEVVSNLVALCQTLLEPLREEFGPISISSGWRNIEVCRQLGSSEKSQHVFGEAADWEARQSESNYAVAKWIEASTLSWDQLILEFASTPEQIADGEGDPMDGWIHLSNKIDKSKNRRVCLRAVKVNGKTKYLEGLD